MLHIDIKKSLHGSSGEMELSIDLDIEDGSFTALAGESGSGKTTILRVLAGLERADGSISIDDEVWLSDKDSMPPQNRNIGFVFQDYALFPNMTLLQNLLYINRDRELANHLLSLTGVQELANRYPNSLSGGQKQRVALSRALMSRPKLLLLDEPLSALDPEMRNRLQSEILTLHNEFKTTTIMVSHEPSEIYKMADRVITIDKGLIVKDISSENSLIQRNSRGKSYLKGEVLSFNQNIVVASVCQQIIEIHSTKEFKVGDTIQIEV